MTIRLYMIWKIFTVCGKTARTRAPAAREWISISLKKTDRSITAARNILWKRDTNPDTLETLLLAHGFDEVRRYADLSFDPPEPQTQRIVFAARRRLT